MTEGSTLPDKIILALAVGFAGSLMLASAGVVFVILTQPERDMTQAIDGITRLLTALVGVIVGYLAGGRHGDHRHYG